MSENKFQKSVVKINTKLGSGTGFFVGENLAISNFHVIEKHREVAIETNDKERLLARVVLADPRRDLALLKIEKPLNVTPLSLRGDEAGATEQVTAVGYPFGLPLTQTQGIISAVNQKVNNLDYYMLDAAINPGNSGGPVVDSKGDVIGVTTLKYNNADNMGFALPSSEAQKILDKYSTINPTEYTVLCPQCSSGLHEGEEHCNSCGYEFDTERFYSQVEQTPLDEFVEDALKLGNFNPVELRSGQSTWNFHSGSSEIRIFRYNNNYVFATSPLVKLPLDSELRSVYEYILSYDKRPYFLSITGDEVFLSFRIHIEDIYCEAKVKDLQSHLAQFLKEADDLDNLLIDKFNCRPAARTLVDKLAS